VPVPNIFGMNKIKNIRDRSINKKVYLSPLVVPIFVRVLALVLI